MKLIIAVCLLLSSILIVDACSSLNFTCLPTDVQIAPYLNVTAPKSSLVTPGVLKLTISSTLLFYNTTIQFDIDTPTSNRTTYCDYFLWQCSSIWSVQQTNGGCNADFVAVFPNVTKALRECFHIATDVTAAVLNQYTVYETNVRVTSYRSGVVVRGLSNATTFSTVLKFQIYFPLNVTLSLNHNVSAYSAPFSVADVISQSFSSVTQQTTVTITTTINPPYQMAGVSNGYPQLTPDQSVANNTFAPINPVQLAGSCPDDNTSICIQNWQLTLTPTGGQCVFSAGLAMQWGITCRPSSAAVEVECEFINIPTTYSLGWNLLSNNFCVQIIDGGALTGVLQPFSDIGLTIPQPSFLYGQTAYFAATVYYNFGPQIIATAFDEMTITSDGTVPLLPSDSGHTSQFNFTSLNATTVFLSFLVSPLVVTLANPDSFQNVNVTVSLTVTYSIANSNELRLQRHRFTTQSSSATSVGTIINVGGGTTTTQSETSGTSSVTYIVPIAVGVGGFVALTALVVLLRRRYFKSERVNSDLPAPPKESDEILEEEAAAAST